MMRFAAEKTLPHGRDVTHKRVELRRGRGAS